MRVSTPIHEIRLLVETDDEDVVAQLARRISLLACPQDDQSADHRCPLPWFLITSEVEDPDGWRDDLNR